MIRLFRVYIPTSVLLLLVSEILFTFAIFAGAIAWQFEVIYLQLDDGWLQAAVATTTIIVGLYLSDCYERVRMPSQILLLQQFCLIIGVAFLVQAVVSYAQLPIRMPRQAMLLGSLLCLIVLPLWRQFYGRLSLQVLGAERVLFAGTHPLQFKLAEYLDDRPEYAMRPCGFAVESESVASRCGSYKVLGTIANLDEILRSQAVDRIIVGIADQADPQVMAKMYELVTSGRHVDTVERVYEVLLGRVPLQRVRADQIFPLDQAGANFAMTAQNVYAWLVALIGVVLLAPVLLMVAIAVRLTSPGPVLFRQVRAGRNNVPFLLYKFRSMYVDAEKHTGAVWAQANDPRVTPIGKYLRQYRLDELPQLFNVLRGEMSIVGPRPERPEFIKMLSEQVPFFMQRLSVKPGITGWAQINYRYGNTIEDTAIKLEFDLFYIKNLSPQLDLLIMFHTIKTMLLTRGAY